LVLVRLPQYGVQAAQLKELQKILAQQLPVRAVGRVLEVPSDLLLPQLIVYKQEQKHARWQPLLWGRMMVMENAPQALGVTLRQGRYFKETDNIRTSVMVNEEAYKQLGGAALAFVTDSTGTPLPAQVVGVLRNFHFESLHRSVAPMVWLKGEGRVGSILVRLYREVQEKDLDMVRKVCMQKLSNVPVVVEKQSELVFRQYDYERVLLRLLGLAWVALVPGFLLTAWIAVRQWIGMRRRSMAIYRLLGASVYDFLWQEMGIYFAFSCLSLPLVWWVQYSIEKSWLQQYFAYFSPVWYHAFFIPLALFMACITIFCFFVFVLWRSIFLPEEFRV
jgi:putative ABC transport system permease protein